MNRYEAEKLAELHHEDLIRQGKRERQAKQVDPADRTGLGTQLKRLFLFFPTSPGRSFNKRS